MVIQKFDLTPLLRSTIGFDRIADLFDDLIPETSGFPPYNIERVGEDTYVITMAVAGFSDKDIDIQVHDDRLIVQGHINKSNQQEREFLHRGVAERDFERQFSLADHVHVMGADLKNGLLTVKLERILPESKLPRKIVIGSGTNGSGGIVKNISHGKIASENGKADSENGKADSEKLQAKTAKKA